MFKKIISVTIFAVLLSGAALAGEKKVPPSKDIGVGSKGSSEKGGLSVSMTGEEIPCQVISSGGRSGSSANYRLNCTISQAAVGRGTSLSYIAWHGFWHGTGGPPPCDCIPGDANNDEQINVGDAVYIIAYVFKGGPPPVPYAICSGDANCDCQCNVGDAVYLINYVFKGGPAPCSCEEWLIECGLPLRN
jgi:hypothetical protein